MKFPDKPTCHADDVVGPAFQGKDAVWQEPETKPREPDGKYPGGGPFRPYRRCSWCGSIHPEDLIAALEAGAELGGSDWKYGWPHKFYISEIPHPYEATPVSFGGRYDKDGYTPEPPRPMGKTNGKWYNVHLLDEGFDEEARFKLIKLLGQMAGIVFFPTPDGKMRYSSPGHGFQVFSKPLTAAKFTEREVVDAYNKMKDSEESGQ